MDKKRRGKTCCVVNCGNNSSSRRKTVKYYSFSVKPHKIEQREKWIRAVRRLKFPKNLESRRLWMKAVRRESWEPSEKSRLCSDHFEEKWFNRLPNSVHLREEAIPTIFSGFPSYLQQASSSSSTLSAEETKTFIQKPACAKRTHPLKNSSPKKLKTEPTVEVSDNLKIVVIPKGYPEVKLIKDQHELVKNYILNKIREELDSQNTIKGPQFNECHCESGALVLNCANSYTKIWLQSLVPLMVRWEGAALIMMDYRDYQNLLRRAKVRLCITGPMKKCSTVEILEVLNHQNKDLCVEEWKVVERSEHERYTSLTMNIDDRSWNKLQENNLKAFLGLGQVFFTVLAKPVRKG